MRFFKLLIFIFPLALALHGCVIPTQAVPESEVNNLLADPEGWVAANGSANISLYEFPAYLTAATCPDTVNAVVKDGHYCVTAAAVPASGEDYETATKRLVVVAQWRGNSTAPTYADATRYTVAAHPRVMRDEAAGSTEIVLFQFVGSLEDNTFAEYQEPPASTEEASVSPTRQP